MSAKHGDACDPECFPPDTDQWLDQQAANPVDERIAALEAEVRRIQVYLAALHEALEQATA